MSVEVECEYETATAEKVLDDPSLENLTPELKAQMDEYLSQFAIFRGLIGKCQCGAELGGFLVGTFTWGLANGEGFCVRCDWPVRAYHKNLPGDQKMVLMLGYHPNFVENEETTR